MHDVPSVTLVHATELVDGWQDSHSFAGFGVPLG
jgi:hypothetical protein